MLAPMVRAMCSPSTWYSEPTPTLPNVNGWDAERARASATSSSALLAGRSARATITSGAMPIICTRRKSSLLSFTAGLAMGERISSLGDPWNR